MLRSLTSKINKPWSSSSAIKSLPLIRKTDLILRTFASKRPKIDFFPNQNTAPKDNGDSNKNEPEKSLSLKEKLQGYWKKYGMIFVVTYGATYWLMLGGFYYGYDTNILSLDSMGINFENGITKICALMTNWGQPGMADTIKNNPEAGKFVVAMLSTDLLEPVRLAMVIPSMPYLARLLGKKDETNTTMVK